MKGAVMNHVVIGDGGRGLRKRFLRAGRRLLRAVIESGKRRRRRKRRKKA